VNNVNVHITPTDYLQYIPPIIEFSLTHIKNQESTTSGPRAHSKGPANVVPWNDFLLHAETFRLETSTTSISPPSFIDYVTKVSDEMDLQFLIRSNILNPINILLKAMGYNLVFTGHSEITSPVLKGWPDHVLQENYEMRSFIESKTIWDLPTPSNHETIIQWWEEDVVAEGSESTRHSQTYHSPFVKVM
jgi:hypothetical protein